MILSSKLELSCTVYYVILQKPCEGERDLPNQQRRGAGAVDSTQPGSSLPGSAGPDSSVISQANPVSSLSPFHSR